jgi:hypothetical protein
MKIAYKIQELNLIRNITGVIKNLSKIINLQKLLRKIPEKRKITEFRISTQKVISRINLMRNIILRGTTTTSKNPQISIALTPETKLNI